MYQLVIVDVRQRKRVIPLRPGRYRIGSDASCEIRLAGGGVCAHHAVIEDRLGGLSIQTLEDGALLQVNGASVAESRLKAGDRIQVGPYTLAVQNRRGSGRKRAVHPVQILAVGSVLALFIVQSIILLKFSYSKQGPIPGAPSSPSTNGTATATDGEEAATGFHVPMSHGGKKPAAARTNQPPSSAITNSAPVEATNSVPVSVETNSPASTPWHRFPWLKPRSDSGSAP